MKKVAVGMAVVFLLLLICTASGDNTVYVTKQNYPMAFTSEDLELFYQGILNDDTAIYLKLRQEGRAWMSKAGLEVLIIEIKGSDKIKIRPKNSTTEIWTLSTAVRKK